MCNQCVPGPFLSSPSKESGCKANHAVYWYTKYYYAVHVCNIASSVVVHYRGSMFNVTENSLWSL